MRLRNLFMILLLCMTVGMFGVSCTGDDGAQGPKGDTGEQGPPGDDGANAGDSMKTYDFLKAWGSDTGTIGCSDPILTGDAAFPGPEALNPILGNDGKPAPEDGIEATCATGVFDDILVDSDGSGKVGVAHGGGSLVFIETGRLIGDDAIETEMEVAATATKFATSTVETKSFVEGTFFADMDTTGGNDEVLERVQLYSDCRIGTPPSDLRGHWRAVKISKVVTQYESPGVQATLNGTAIPSEETVTTKVCLKLDSTPGIVKCFIREGTAAAGKEQVALYDSTAEPGKELTTVKAGDDPTNLGRFAGSDGEGGDDLFGAEDDFENENRLCRIFEEARPTS